MSDRSLNLLSGFFSLIWRFLQIKIPTTNVTFASVFLLCALVPIIIQFLRNLFGYGGGSLVSGSVRSSRSRANRGD